MNRNNQQKREALLKELESIRHLLGEDAQHDGDLELLVKAGKIPLLIPDEPVPGIPTLVAEDEAGTYIPVLSAVAADTAPPPPPAPAPDLPKPDPLDAIRQAAARVAANAQRARSSIDESTPPPSSAPTTAPAALPPGGSSEREKLVDDVVRAALPRVELLLRELVQEALLQDKLRGNRR